MVELKYRSLFPDSFFEEEIRNGHTVTAQMKEIWAVELDLYIEFKRVCEKYNLKYYASDGTLLGAVRHNGFIPWDDDIDVRMFRDDYNKLCEIAPNEFAYPYFFQTEYTDRGSLYSHAKLRNSETTGILTSQYHPGMNFNQGIFFDIFPIDSVCDDELLLNEQMRRADVYRSRSYYAACYSLNFWLDPRTSSIKNTIKSLIQFCVYPIAKALSLYYYKKMEDTYSMYNDTATKRVGLFVWGNMKKCYSLRKDYDDIILMNFEFLKIPVPIGYNDILDRIYGNWHQFVKGGGLHGGVLFDTNKSYLNYLKKRDADDSYLKCLEN